MVRYCDDITIYELQGEIYDPFGEDNINRTVIYEGECKSVLNIARSGTYIPDDENYIITIPQNNLTDINIRNIAYLKTNNNDNELTKLTIIAVKRYARNTVIQAIAIKDGDTQ